MNPFDANDPESAKLRFNLRSFLNWVLVIFIFSAAAVIFDSVLVDIITGILLFVIYAFFLANRVIGFKCPNSNCQRFIETNRAWTCGNKDQPHRNDNVDEFPFINKCEHCGNEPKAYQCHHCGELIFFTKDRSRFGFAKCADYIPEKRPQTPVKRDEHIDDLERRRREIKIKELEVEQAKLDITLKGLKENLSPVKMKTMKETYKERVKNEDDLKELKKEIDEEFKNDPDERRKRHLMADDAYRGGFM